MAKKSYSSILKSSSLIGGSKLVGMVIGVVRTKFAAILIGPAGLGLLSTLMSIQQMVIALAGLGMSKSAVRDISEARGNEDSTLLYEIVTVVRRLSLILGIAGSIIIAFFAGSMSQWMAGDDSATLQIAALAISVFILLNSGARRAILQGHRRIAEIAKIEIISVSFGSLLAVIWYVILGKSGVVPAILTLATVRFSTTWFYSRKIRIPKQSIERQRFFELGRSLLGLGLAMMWNGLLVAGMAYLLRMIVLKEFDLATVGIYYAAYGISAMVVNFVLNAMTTDYVPRLSEVASEPARMVQLANEQAEVGMLMSLPGVVALIVMAPFLIEVLYSAEFLGAVELTQLFALGCFSRIFQWPLGYIIIAQKRSALFAFLQTLFFGTRLGVTILLLPICGLSAVAISMLVNAFISYCFIYVVIRKQANFRWSAGAMNILLKSVCVVVVLFYFSYYHSSMVVTISTLAALPLVTSICIREIYIRTGGHPKMEKIKQYCPRFMSNFLFPERT